MVDCRCNRGSVLYRAYTSFPIKTKCCFAIRGAPLGVWKWRITRAISAEGGWEMRKSPLHGNRAGSSGLSWPTRRHTCRPYLLRTILHGIHTHTHTHPWLAIFKWETRLRHNGGWRFTSWAVRPTSFLRQITLLTTRFPSRWGVSFETRDFDTRVLPKFLSFRLERSRVWD